MVNRTESGDIAVGAPGSDARKIQSLLFGGSCDVPKQIAVCPECKGPLEAISEEWIAETGQPTFSLLVGCQKFDGDNEHKHFQSDWQSTIDTVQKWAGCVET